ncbi:MAG: hypothetical protein UZ10_BCD003000118 [Bacteroidetes bacterium OLB10]|nr:MAG: hypothetical protein UZ10_BCD003000118 [Bacteroidetes bacterium OLB10]
MKLLIPVDFTSLTENAYSYALQLPFVNEIVLFHATATEKEKTSAMEQLNKIRNDFKIPSQITVSTLIKQGDFYDLIGETATEIKCRTHSDGYSRSKRLAAYCRQPCHEGYHPFKNTLHSCAEQTLSPR